MFEYGQMLYLYVETPLHAGSGRGLGAVDLPIQRERVTGYPLVQASGIKGALRSECENRAKDKTRIKFVFGPDTTNASEHAGALSPGDARILLFPVRSLAGVFAWTTSVEVLARLQRDARAVGEELTWQLPKPPEKKNVLVSSNKSAVIAGGKVVLEEFAFEVTEDESVAEIAKWLVKHALPESDEYTYWRDKLSTRLVILPEDAFRDFTQYATEIATRIKLDDETKTVEGGGLWTEEHLPVDTLLYSPLVATAPRKAKKENPPNDLNSAETVLKFVAKHLDRQRIQLGGDETVGRGIVALRFGDAHALNGR